MKVLVYAPTSDGTEEHLRRVIGGLVPEAQIHQTMEGLCEGLRQPREDMILAVLLAQSKEELERLIAIRSLLSDVRIILILPDRDKETIAKGHSLRPRFLTYSDADFRDISAVLDKISGACKGQRLLSSAQGASHPEGLRNRG